MYLQPGAKAALQRVPTAVDLSKEVQRERLSGGDEGVAGPDADLDACCAYLVWLKRVGLALGLPANLVTADADALDGSAADPHSSDATDGAEASFTDASVARFRPGFVNPPDRLTAALHTPPLQELIRLCGKQVAQVEIQLDGQLATLVYRVPPVVLANKQDTDYLDAVSKHARFSIILIISA
jgi:hypothetical protein